MSFGAKGYGNEKHLAYKSNEFEKIRNLSCVLRVWGKLGSVLVVVFLPPSPLDHVAKKFRAAICTIYLPGLYGRCFYYLGISLQHWHESMVMFQQQIDVFNVFFSDMLTM